MNSKILMLYIINDTYIANALYSEIHVQSLSNYTVHETFCFYCTVYIFYIHIQCTGTLMFPFFGSKLLTAMKGGKIISSIKINKNFLSYKSMLEVELYLGLYCVS